MKQVFLWIILTGLFSPEAFAHRWFRLQLFGKSIYLKKGKLLDDLQTNRHVDETHVLRRNPPISHLETFNAIRQLIQNRLPNPTSIQENLILTNLDNLLNEYRTLEVNDHFVPEEWLNAQLENLGILRPEIANEENANEENEWVGFIMAAEAAATREEAAREAAVAIVRAQEWFRRFQQWRQFQQLAENRPTGPGRSTVAMGNRPRMNEPALYPDFFKRNFWR